MVRVNVRSKSSRTITATVTSTVVGVPRHAPPSSTGRPFLSPCHPAPVIALPPLQPRSRVNVKRQKMFVGWVGGKQTSLPFPLRVEFPSLLRFHCEPFALPPVPVNHRIVRSLPVHSLTARRGDLSFLLLKTYTATFL